MDTVSIDVPLAMSLAHQEIRRMLEVYCRSLVTIEDISFEYDPRSEVTVLAYSARFRTDNEPQTNIINGELAIACNNKEYQGAVRRKPHLFTLIAENCVAIWDDTGRIIVGKNGGEEWRVGQGRRPEETVTRIASDPLTLLSENLNPLRPRPQVPGSGGRKVRNGKKRQW